MWEEKPSWTYCRSGAQFIVDLEVAPVTSRPAPWQTTSAAPSAQPPSPGASCSPLSVASPLKLVHIACGNRLPSCRAAIFPSRCEIPGSSLFPGEIPGSYSSLFDKLFHVKLLEFPVPISFPHLYSKGELQNTVRQIYKMRLNKRAQTNRLRFVPEINHNL